MKRPTRKPDANQSEIVESLRRCGAFVEDTHTLGQGFPDILVCYNAKWTPIEIKTRGGKLTPDETTWWEKVGTEPNIARDDQEAMKLCGIPIVPFDDPFGLVKVPVYEYPTSGKFKVRIISD